MSTVVPPTALTISIPQALALLDGPFAGLADGVAKRQYAFWLGSGISRERVDDLKKIIARVLTALRERIDPAIADCQYRLALDEALGYAQLSDTDRKEVDYAKPIEEWPAIDTILRNLCGAYSKLLDIRIDGQLDDYLLWDIVDVPHTFAPATMEPDCEHLCIGILILEGMVPDIASANWDGFIEAAIQELTGAAGGALRVCVRTEDLRAAPLLTRLLKFHGCAVLAGIDPRVYRPLLIARQSQITAWPTNPAYAPMKHELVTLAATKPTLMIGLSSQDTNIQHVFAEGQALMAWGWPCTPPAHVFAEDKLGTDQRNILRVVYSAAYTGNRLDIEASALLRAYAKPALTALVLHVLASKLRAFAQVVHAPSLVAADRGVIESGISRLRDRLADNADADRLAFIRALVAFTSRGLALFQIGDPPTSSAYRPISATPVQMIPTDASLETSGIREMAAALGLLGLGETDALWAVEPPSATNPKAGVLDVVTARGRTRVFFAANDRAGVHLEINALVTRADSDAVVIHSTSPAPTMARSPRGPRGRTGRVGVREVAMADLLREARNIGELRLRFQEEASL